MLCRGPLCLLELGMLKQNKASAYMVAWYSSQSTSGRPTSHLCTDRAKPQQQLLLGPHEGYTTAVPSSAGSCFGFATESFGFAEGTIKLLTDSSSHAENCRNHPASFTAPERDRGVKPMRC